MSGPPTGDTDRPYDLRAWGRRRPVEELEQLADAVIARLCERVFPLPAGVEHEGDYLRLTHGDLAEMSDVRLSDEAARARLRGYLERPLPPWLLERIEAIGEEQRRRRELAAASARRR